MTDGIAAGGPRGADLGRAVERIAAAVRHDARQASREQWLGQVGQALREAQPVVEQLASTAVDPIALGEARDRIAAMLADVEALASGTGRDRADLSTVLDGMVPPVPLPLAPGASEDAVAAAQAVAQLIAANARPAIGAQARLGRAAVKSVIGE